MPTDSNEESNKILADILKETDSEESIVPKKEIKNPFKDKKDDDFNEYDFSDDKGLDDTEW